MADAERLILLASLTRLLEDRAAPVRHESP
jgi:hypothetical protein